MLAARHRHQSTKTSRIVPALMNAWLQPDALTMPDDRPRAAGSRLRQLWPDRQDVSAVTGSFGARRHRQRQRYEWERRTFTRYSLPVCAGAPTVWITLVYAFGTLLLSSTHVGGRVGRCNLLPGLRETCMGDGILGVPWWVLVILVVAAVAGTMAGRSMGRAKAHRKAVEKMAEAADAEHEGAKTRHE